MASFFSNLFKSHEKGSVLGIDIGSSAIKIVQLTRKGGKALLETYGELALGPYADREIGQATNLPTEKIIEALLDLMREKEVNLSSNRCGVAIPFSSALMSLIEMPFVSKKQLDAMIPLEARKYIPVPISEVALDWSIVPRDENEERREEESNPLTKIKKTDILLVAIHNDTIAKYKDIVEKTGLSASFYEIEIFSCLRSVLDEEKGPVMIFDMGAATTKLYIVERGVVRLSHTINRGSQDITNTISKSLGVSVAEAEEMKRSIGANIQGEINLKEIVQLSLAHVFTEANQVILNYEKKYDKTLSKIILVGGGSALRGLAPLAQENFQIKVEAGNPFSKIETPAFLSEILKQTGPEFAVAVGVALRRLEE